MNNLNSTQIRIYSRKESVVFRKTKEGFGGLSNMASGFPLEINGIYIPSSEALYQACRFPNLPEIQNVIIMQTSPMTAKMKSKPHRKESRPDWERLKVKIMRWCLRVKLAQNWGSFGQLLLSTEDKPIVEESRKDEFWGAKVIDKDTLQGFNILGRLLMELREKLKQENNESLAIVEPLEISDFLLDGKPIPTLYGRITKEIEKEDTKTIKADSSHQMGVIPGLVTSPQGSFFSSSNSHEYKPDSIVTKFSLKPYAAYKDSGMPWVGKIPEHWQVKRVKTIFRYKKEINQEGVNTNVLSLTLRGVVNNDPENPEGLVPKDYRSYQLFDKDDLVFKLIDLENLQTSRVGLVHENGIMSPAYVRLILKKSGVLRYFFQQFFDLYERGIYNQLGAGVRSTLGPNDLLNISILEPQVSEQNAIVYYLTYVGTRIRRFIGAKRKLITLLNEQKQTIIQQAVTKGNNPNMRFKPSGVDWLGDIPAHWEIKPAKYYFHEVDVRSETGAEELLSVSHITGVTPRSQKNITMFKASSYIGQKLCRPNDLVINTMWAWMGALGIARQSGIVSSSYGVYRLIQDSQLTSDFADLLLRTRLYVSEYLLRSTGIRSSRLRLYPEQFLRIKLVCPPVDEQYKIIKSISSQIVSIQKAIEITQREISLLKELQTNINADIVTGKMDVKEVAANLPVELETQDISDIMLEEPEIPEDEEVEPSLAEVEDA